MDNKPIKYIFLVLGSLVLLAIGTFFGSRYMCENKGSEKVKPKGMMLLIEFNNTDGLANMVNDMRERNIKGLLMVNADFIKKNAEELESAS